MASYNKLSLSDHQEIGILTGDPPPIWIHRPGCDSVIDPDCWVSFGGGGTGAAGGGAPTGTGGYVDIGNWLGPGNQGGGGTPGQDPADLLRKALEEEQKRRLNESFGALRDATKVVKPILTLFEGSSDEADFEITDKAINDLYNDKLIDLFNFMTKLAPLGGLLSGLSFLIVLLGQLLQGKIVADKLPELVSDLKDAMRTMNDILRQQRKREMALNILSKCPPLTGDICTKANLDLAMSTIKLQQDNDHLIWLEDKLAKFHWY